MTFGQYSARRSRTTTHGIAITTAAWIVPYGAMSSRNAAAPRAELAAITGTTNRAKSHAAAGALGNAGTG